MQKQCRLTRDKKRHKIVQHELFVFLAHVFLWNNKKIKLNMEISILVFLYTCVLYAVSDDFITSSAQL